jgi:hypothetical protein
MFSIILIAFAACLGSESQAHGRTATRRLRNVDRCTMSGGDLAD